MAADSNANKPSVARLLGRTLLGVSLIVGLSLSALAVVFTLIVGFRNLESSASVIERVNVPRLSALLWELSPQTEEYLRTMLYLPYVHKLELETDDSAFSLSDPDFSERVERRDFTLTYERFPSLGVLRVYFSRSELLRDALRTSALLALVLVGALGAAFLLQYRLFRLWLTEPLTSLSELTRHLTLDTLDKPLEWSGQAAKAGKTRELDGLAHTLEDMRRNLHASLGERDRLQHELLRSEERYREVFDSAGDAILLHRGKTTELLEANRAALGLFKTSEPELFKPGGFASFLAFESPYDEARALKMLERSVDEGPQLFEWRMRDSKNRVFWAEVSLTAVMIGGELQVISSIRDIDARKRAESEAFHLQKLDSIGRLAGGIAHDFNNTLQSILAECELGMMDAEAAGKSDGLAVQSFQAIKEGVMRSAMLTKQLLTFARKGMSDPKPLDLNAALTSMHKLLRRLVPETIHLALKPCALPLRVFVDDSQLDQLLTNLVVNARDAIEGSGSIVVETESISFSREDAQIHPSFVPGDYALLTVSDTGCGMDDALRERIFEPFFTTKPSGQGTGLGLSTVFGIMQQSKGFIQVYSEPGRGSSFKAYFPLSTASLPQGDGEARAALRGKGELVVLVDDDAQLAHIGERQLRTLGYEPWVFTDPKEAWATLEGSLREPAALVTDLVMPGLSGVELEARLKRRFPAMRSLFVSGYSADLLPAVEDRRSLLSKPYTLERLAIALHSLLKPGAT
jgi:PAS domain S-box-containing protein